METLRVFLSGGSGFIGSSAIKALEDDGHEVVTIIRDRTNNNRLSKIHAQPNIVYGDLRDYNTVLRTVRDYEVDVICHLAADAVVKTSLLQPNLTFENNLLTTINIAEVSRKADVKHLIMWSTDKIFGNGPYPASDDQIPNPQKPYETSKYCSELIMKSYSLTYNIPLTTTRCCNVYGPYDTSPRVVSNTIKSCLKEQSPIIYKNNNTKREYIYIDDAADALVHIVQNKLLGNFNVSTGETKTQEDVVNEILTHFPLLKPIYEEPKEYSKHEIGNQEIDSSKLRKAGWFPQVSFEEGVRITIEEERKFLRAELK